VVILSVQRSITYRARARAARIRVAPAEHHIHNFNDEVTEPRTIVFMTQLCGLVVNKAMRSICTI
jgi:hypothetical protein